MSKYNFIYEQQAKRAGKSWVYEQYQNAQEKLGGYVPLSLMIQVVEQFILMNTGQRVTIRLRTFPGEYGFIPDGNNSLVGIDHNDLQLLGRAYDIATGKVFTKL